MMTLLLLKEDIHDQSEICNLFSSAGYRINWGKLPNETLAWQQGVEPYKSITILKIDLEQLSLLQTANHAVGTTLPWRLSLHQRSLIAPNSKKTKLTSLEFTLIKIFALTEMGQVASRKKIIDEFGEHYLSYDQNRLDTMITRLRKKVKNRLELTLPLNTVRVRGFSFDDLLILEH
jgi:DNA-binding winged helix-turn-helix (wHTH) protein